MSKTLYTKTDFKNHEALALAVESLGGRVLGHGTHNLYASREQGYGIVLPKWKYPLVIKSDGQFAYDDYHGCWGNIEDIAGLESAYRIEAAAAAAAAQGWQTERTEAKLVIYHPSGGTITITPDGMIDAECFTSSECELSTDIIAKAIGTVTRSHIKPAYYAEYAKVVQHEGPY